MTKPTMKRIGCSMLGVTTPCVKAVGEHLESDYSAQVYVFDAIGHGTVKKGEAI